METDIIKKIALIEEQIENSLSAEDFLTVSRLSMELDQSIKEFTRSIKPATFTEIEKTELKNLLVKLNNYKRDTLDKFKRYTSKVSQQRKMHQAYKQ